MRKNIILIAISTLFFIGCGGTGATDGGSSNNSSSSKEQGEYALWDYMVPKQSHNSTFTLKTGSDTSTYKTSYKVSRSHVEEVADYAPDEETVYTKKPDRIVVEFKKNNKANGTYDLHLRANIGDKVTKRPSDCRLVRHHDTLEFAGKEFDDVIEIRCNDIPGYYQKGVGEIGQKEDKTGKTIRVLSN